MIRLSRICPLVLTLLTAHALYADPPRSPELFFDFGALKWGGDESSRGTTAAWGGSAVIPLTSALAVDAGILTAKWRPPADRQQPYRTRRILITPSLLYRAGSPAFYGYVGGGIGAEIDRSFGPFQFLIDPEPPGQWTTRFTHMTSTGRTYHLRGGFVASPTGHLVIRVDLFGAFRYVYPNSAIKVGVGYRF